MVLPPFKSLFAFLFPAPFTGITWKKTLRTVCQAGFSPSPDLNPVVKQKMVFTLTAAGLAAAPHLLGLVCVWPSPSLSCLIQLSQVTLQNSQAVIYSQKGGLFPGP